LCVGSARAGSTGLTFCRMKAGFYVHVIIIALAALIGLGLTSPAHRGAPPVAVPMDTQQAGGPS